MRLSSTLPFLLLFLFSTTQWASAQNDIRQDNPQPTKSYSNIVSASPLPVTALEGETFFGAAIEYERFFSAKGHFSINLPLFAGKIGLQQEHGTLYTVSPGFRYHPVGNTHKLDYSFGPELLMGRGKYAFFVPDSYPKEWQNVVALLFETDLDWHVKGQGLVGAHLAVGKYFDNSSLPGIAIQLGVKIGGRF